MRRKGILLVILLSLVTGYSFGQKVRQGDNLDNKPPANNHLKVKQQMAEEAYRNRRREQLRNQRFEEAFGNLTVNPTKALRYPPLTRAEKAKLTPAKTDKLKYANFLKRKRTGIAKILPDPKCGGKLVISATNKKCQGALHMRGGGAFYSFTRKYVPQDSGDIHYINNHFRVSFTDNIFGLISKLGDVPIEMISSETLEVSNLKEYKVPKNIIDIEKGKKVIESGIRIGKNAYSNQVSVKLDNTYILRSVDYQWRGKFWGADVIVAFRVIRIDSDGAITILWSRLKKKGAPYLRK